MRAHHSSTCAICANHQNNEPHQIREIRYGTNEVFDYFRCARCGCLQITTVPENLAEYYPTNYYSFLPTRDIHATSPILARRAIRRGLIRLANSPHGGVASLMRRLKTPCLPAWMAPAGIGLDDEILDVGCGTGGLLLTLFGMGCSRLTGLDPFVKQTIQFKCGVTVHKLALSELDGQFDFIMMNSAFEHVPDPVQTLQHIHRLLRPMRFALIEVPVVDSYAWRRYGAEWVQIDAPRHLFLHSRRSMQIVAQSAGFEIAHSECHSYGWQLLGSELVQRRIVLEPRSVHLTDEDGEFFSRRDVHSLEARAQLLNANDEGDQVRFYLFKPE